MDKDIGHLDYDWNIIEPNLNQVLTGRSILTIFSLFFFDRSIELKIERTKISNAIKYMMSIKLVGNLILYVIN